MHAGLNITISGLSPRLRGNPLCLAKVRAPRGSIPAPAGEPPLRVVTASMRPVYPRACGGTQSMSNGRHTLKGLSPRLRGNQWQCLAVSGGKRSIPAPAGEPGWPSGPGTTPPVYPRACGGTRLAFRTRHNAAGLSPRLRGNHIGEPNRLTTARSIPAPAGEPNSGYVRLPCMWVYPRACGGTFPRNDNIYHKSGLSPRLRGNLNGDAIWWGTVWSIPAPAGEPPHPRR